MAIEKLILDESNREKRERALGRSLTEDELELEDKPEMQLHGILDKHEKLFGEYLREKYGAEADGLFERFASEDAGLEDLKKINDARYGFQAAMQKAEKMRAGLLDGDIRQLAGRSEDFDAIAGLLENDKRTAEVIRDHFYRLAVRGDNDLIEKIIEAQEELRLVRGSPELKQYENVAEKFMREYGFNTAQWSEIEKVYKTRKERERIEADVRSTMNPVQRLWSWVLSGDKTFGPSPLVWLGADPVRNRGNKQVRAGRKEGEKAIREHLKQQGAWFVGSKSRSASEQIGKLEEGKIMTILKEQFDVLGTTLAATMSDDKHFLKTLTREAKSKGAEKAEPIDKTTPMTFAELKQRQGLLNDNNYKTAFKAYLKQRREKEGLDTTSWGDYEKGTEVDRFHQQYGKSESPGFMAQLLAGLMRLFSTEKKTMLRDNALWA